MKVQYQYLLLGANPNQNTYPPQLPPLLSGGGGSGFVSTAGQYNYFKRTGLIPDVTVPQFYGDLLLQIDNEGTVATVMTINQSSDNGQTDPYASNVVTFYVQHVGVTSLAVPAGGRSSFVIASVLGSVTKPYYRITTTLNTRGKIGIASFNELLELRNIEGVP